MIRSVLFAIAALPFVTPVSPALAFKVTPPPGLWVADQGDGTYRNPVLQGDYSDPDVVRVGDDYYLTSSSFTNVPGLPVLHSKDLINWRIIGHALAVVPPVDHFRVPRRGGGVWAPAIRYHAGRFMIFYPDPDFGIFMVSAKDPAGPWTQPVLIDSTKGAIDPCPFWDSDGQGWLVHAFAASRAGKNNQVVLKRLNAAGTKTVGEAKLIIDGARLPPVESSLGPSPWTTIEGPKLYKRDGWYYVFVPAGGVKNGWQGVFRSRHIDGPYEGRDVMDQGPLDALAPANGPHQGAWVTVGQDQDWFLHFQDTDAYGRRVWLEPMRWLDGWPVIGAAVGNAARGVPLVGGKKPVAGQPVAVPVADDDFKGALNAAWQWNANPGDDWADLKSHPGFLRLNAIPGSANLWETGNELTQKLPAQTFSAVTKISLSPAAVGERAGLLVLGYNYGFIGLENARDGIVLEQVTRLDANAGGTETKTVANVKITGDIWLKVHMEPRIVPATPDTGAVQWPAMSQAIDAQVTFSYSTDGEHFTPLGDGFTARPGRWVGAQIGLFAQAPTGTPSTVATRNGWAEFGGFHIAP